MSENPTCKTVHHSLSGRLKSSRAFPGCDQRGICPAETKICRTSTGCDEVCRARSQAHQRELKARIMLHKTDYRISDKPMFLRNLFSVRDSVSNYPGCLLSMVRPSAPFSTIFRMSRVSVTNDVFPDLEVVRGAETALGLRNRKAARKSFLAAWSVGTGVSPSRARYPRRKQTASDKGTSRQRSQVQRGRSADLPRAFPMQLQSREHGASSLSGRSTNR